VQICNLTHQPNPHPIPPHPPHQTTANTLSYAIYCLSAHPEAQQRLLAELDALEGPRERDITVDDLAKVRLGGCAVLCCAVM